MDVLKNPMYYALTGEHADLAESQGRAVRYPAQVAPFLGLPDDPTEQDWADAAELLGADHAAALMRPDLPLPAFIKLVQQFDLVQLVAPEGFGATHTADMAPVGNGVAAGDAAGDPEGIRPVVLGPDDVPEMLALIELTDPGPFRARTIEMGSYLGLRDGDRLIAMAGERCRPPGYVEISAVCTDPAYRGRGLATRLIREVAAGIEQAGAHPFLHTGGTNTTAIRLYEGLGFTVSNRMKVTIVQPV
ncbi:GNAT family N-acetyltransferase [Kribbella sp. NPDC006257]|uniref:GNAT family N-acetyltransferase n=1 Tax=Kribbella sp. NPDC006257 TaxID=3156738 RepID=UPI0033A7C85A